MNHFIRHANFRNISIGITLRRVSLIKSIIISFNLNLLSCGNSYYRKNPSTQVLKHNAVLLNKTCSVYETRDHKAEKTH